MQLFGKGDDVSGSIACVQGDGSAKLPDQDAYHLKPHGPGLIDVNVFREPGPIVSDIKRVYAIIFVCSNFYGCQPLLFRGESMKQGIADDLIDNQGTGNRPVNV